MEWEQVAIKEEPEEEEINRWSVQNGVLEPEAKDGTETGVKPSVVDGAAKTAETSKKGKKQVGISITSLINDPRIQGLLTEGLGPEHSKSESLGTNVIVNEDMLLVLQTLKPKPSTDDGLIFKVVPLQYFTSSSPAPLKHVGRKTSDSSKISHKTGKLQYNLVKVDPPKTEGEQTSHLRQYLEKDRHRPIAHGSDDESGSPEKRNTLPEDLGTSTSGDIRLVNMDISETRDRDTTSPTKFITIPYKMVNVDPNHHTSRRLPMVRSSKPPDKMSKCDICGSTFMHRSGLSRHKRIMHRGLKYACPYCGELFTRTDSLQDHARRQHPGQVADLVPVGSYKAAKTEKAEVNSTS